MVRNTHWHWQLLPPKQWQVCQQPSLSATFSKLTGGKVRPAHTRRGAYQTCKHHLLLPYMVINYHHHDKECHLEKKILQSFAHPPHLGTGLVCCHINIGKYSPLSICKCG